MPRAERDPFLRQECGPDEGLRREVASLLAFDPEPEFLARTPANALLAASDAADLLRVGDYELREKIGSGGMCTVWRAVRRHAGFELVVAVKVLNRGMDTAALVHRFGRERRILASLDHSGIARLLDGGATDDGRPFLVMEFVQGTRIDDFARTLELERRLALFAAVCDAVHWAHERGIVHRDLKPANVLVTAEGHAKLLDFGIAKLLGAEDLEASFRTSAASDRAIDGAGAQDHFLAVLAHDAAAQFLAAGQGHRVARFGGLRRELERGGECQQDRGQEPAPRQGRMSRWAGEHRAKVSRCDVPAPSRVRQNGPPRAIGVFLATRATVRA